ncbi:hypothetical protein AHAS_Ahas17G0093300 [Arachis hypogaea]
MHLISPHHIQNFFRAPFELWLRWNLTSKLGRDPEDSWITLFMVTCWQIWRWQNKEIFSPQFKRPNEAKNIILNLVNEIETTFPKEAIFTQERKRIEVQVAWKPPMKNWVKVNTDGASRGNPGQAGCGGMVRNELGRWVAGFIANLGNCTTFQAEI